MSDNFEDSENKPQISDNDSNNADNSGVSHSIVDNELDSAVTDQIPVISLEKTDTRNNNFYEVLDSAGTSRNDYSGKHRGSLDDSTGVEQSAVEQANDASYFAENQAYSDTDTEVAIDAEGTETSVIGSVDSDVSDSKVESEDVEGLVSSRTVQVGEKKKTWGGRWTKTLVILFIVVLALLGLSIYANTASANNLEEAKKRQENYNSTYSQTSSEIEELQNQNSQLDQQINSLLTEVNGDVGGVIE